MELKPVNKSPTAYPVTGPQEDQLRHRYNYHAPKDGQAPRYEEIRAKVGELAIFISQRCPQSRELSTNAAIARNET